MGPHIVLGRGGRAASGPVLENDGRRRFNIRCNSALATEGYALTASGHAGPTNDQQTGERIIDCQPVCMGT